jgi:hypothetical protein
VRLSGVAALVPTPAVTDLGLQPEQAVDLLADSGAVVYEVRATMPGEVVDSNAEVDGRVLTWRIAPGERIALVAVAEQPGGPWWVLAVSGALGGLLTLALLAGLRGRAGRSGPRRGD